MSSPVVKGRPPKGPPPPSKTLLVNVQPLIVIPVPINHTPAPDELVVLPNRMQSVIDTMLGPVQYRPPPSPVGPSPLTPSATLPDRVLLTRCSVAPSLAMPPP